MSCSITTSQLDNINNLLNAGDKSAAVSAIIPVIESYFADVQIDGGPWGYLSDQIGARLQETLTRIRRECPDECKVSDVEVLRFQLGDRVYGYNLDESAILFALSPSIGAGNLIIDHLNDHYRAGSQSIDKQTSNAYGPAWVESPEISEKQQNIVQSYTEFYDTHPKLAAISREPVTDSTEKKKATTMINRACKAGILKTVLDGNTVHFNLDHFISDKSFAERSITKGEKTAQGSVPGFFTVKELRFIKRLGEVDPELGKRVIFYQNGKQVEPPWKKNPESWQRYQRNPTTKGLEATLTALDKHSRSGTGDAVKQAAVNAFEAVSVATKAVAVASDLAEKNRPDNK